MKKPLSSRSTSQPPRRGKPPATGNPLLAKQTRKILGKHYAAKYKRR